MPDINELKRIYLESSSKIYADSKITPLIDAVEYNSEIEHALFQLGMGATPQDNQGQFILIANWWLGLSDYTPDYYGYLLDGTPATGGSRKLINLLKEKARNGVDVRVMGWISYSVTDNVIARQSGGESFAALNAHTMKSILDLRAEPAIGSKAILNVLSHPAGAVHAKLVVMGDNTKAVGFTGGLDFAPGRYAHPEHSDGESWHDVVAMVEGPAAQALYDWYKSLWNENIDSRRKVIHPNFSDQEIPSVLPGAPILPDRNFTGASAGTHHVQSLRTFPSFQYSSPLPFLFIPKIEPLSFAPNGMTELASAWEKALINASTYIYMEDQCFWSQEIMGWINQAVKAHANLRVILLGKGGADPNDPDLDEHPILCESINRRLLEGLSSDQIQRIRMYRLWGDTLRLPANFNLMAVEDQGAVYKLTTNLTLPETAKDVLAKQKFYIHTWSKAADGSLVEVDLPVVGNEKIPAGGPLIVTVKPPGGLAAPDPGASAYLRQTTGILTHAKITIVDDCWGIIGSANCTQRSLYTDIEHAVSFVDADNTAVKEYRKKLWAKHFRHSNPDDFEDIEASLNGWESSWGTAGAAPSRPSRASDDPGPPYLEPVALPLSPDVPLDGWAKNKYERFKDVDSRRPWRLSTPLEP